MYDAAGASRGILAELPLAAGEHRAGLTLGYAERETLTQLPGRLHAGLTQIMPGVPGELAEPVSETETPDEAIDPYFGFIAARSSLGLWCLAVRQSRWASSAPPSAAAVLTDACHG